MPQIRGDVCDKLLFFADDELVAADEEGGDDNEDIVCGGVGEGVDDVDDEFC